MHPGVVSLATTALSISETVSPSAVGSLRRKAAAAAAAAGAEPATVQAIRLCVSEALANAALHAYPEQGGVVELVVALEDDEFVVTVRDYGRGIRASAAARRAEGGVGLGIIRELTDRYRITSDSDGGTEIRMTFARGVSQPAFAAQP